MEGTTELTEVGTACSPRRSKSAEGGPSLALVFGHFSAVARVRNWEHIEAFLNPNGMFRQVHVIAIGDDYEYEALHFGTVEVHPVRSFAKWLKLRRINDLICMIMGVRLLTRIVRERHVDVVAQIDSTPLKFGLPAVLVALRMGIPSIITLCSDYQAASIHNPSITVRWLGKLLWPFVFKHATRVRSKSRYIAEFASRYDVPASKIRVIPNKEALDEFRVRPTQKDLDETAARLGISELIGRSVVLVTCARLIEIKNIPRMLEAVALARKAQPNLALLVAGVGPLQASLEARARELDLSSHVRFLGYLPHKTLSLAYHMSDIFLFPTLFEGNPRALLEARLAGLPVIASNHGSIRELVADGRGGRLVDPLSAEAIASAIAELAGSPELRRRMGRDPTFDPEMFSIGVVSAQEEALYVEVLDESRGSSKAT